MSKTKWTKEQQLAIDTRRCNLLVAAAAGSGKTAVLVERIIKIIINEDEPIDIDRLLVVTFTNAAASEMRERIADAISKELEKNPNSTILQKQLTLLSRSNITTMHSFCLDVIKNNFHTIDLDPGFRIGDETEGTLIKLEIIDELFDEMYDNEDSEFLNLVEAYCNSKDDKKLKELVLDIFRFSMSGPWPEKWLNDSAEEFNIKTLEDLNNTNWVKILKNDAKTEVDSCINMLGRGLEIIYTSQELTPYIENFEDDINQLNALLDVCNDGIIELYNGFNKVDFKRIKTIKKKDITDESIQKTVKDIRDGVKKKIKGIKENIFSMNPNEFLESTQMVYPYMKKLAELVLEFKKRFELKKKEKGILDFNDLEHLCLKILIEENEGNIVPSKVALRFREYFDEVLVDEYQDSNNVQETIIDLVSRKNTDRPNVFMVGDVKQSIYRFRQAKPELFLDKYRRYSLTEGNEIKIQLYKNFRSRLEVITGTNYIFKETMSNEVGELEYTDEEALNLGATYKECNEDNVEVGGPIEVHIVDKKEEIDKSEYEEDSEEDLNSINLEAKIVAKRIKEMMDVKSGKVFKVFDRGLDGYRHLKYKDIVILLRATKNWSEIFLEELGKEGIPVYADTGSGYFEAIEIRTIMALLQVIDNPRNDVPMIALLRSPIVGFTAEELVDLRMINKENYFYENLLLIPSNDKLSGDIKSKAINIINNINGWRKEALYTPIDELIWKLYMETGYYGFVGAMPNGVLRQANLRILFQRAKQFEKTSFKGLFNFINFINKLRSSAGDMGSAKILGENEDVVRIMSIHKSKGLEFPVTFLSGAGKNFNLMDLKNTILYHHDLGLGPEYVNLEKRISYSTLAKEAIKKKVKLETLSEEMRILYVAFTRAKEKLIITGAVNDLEKTISKWVSAASIENNRISPSEVMKGKSYLDWIGYSLCQHRDGKVLTDYIGDNNCIGKDDLSTWKVKLWSKNEIIVDEKKSDVDKFENNELFIKNDKKFVDEEIERRLGFRYKYKDAVNLRSNFSVSDVKKKNQEEIEELEGVKLYKEPILIKPKFMQEEKGLSSAEKGTAMHFVMQALDLNNISSVGDIITQLKDMVDQDLITEKEYNSVRATKIRKFFDSKLGQIMIQSHKQGKKIYNEIPFYTEIRAKEVIKDISEEVEDEKVRLQGIIDCFFETEDGYILLDYKTDYVESNNEDEFKKKYEIQIKYYEEAIFRMTGKRVKESYLYSFYLDKEIKL
ncbi:MAG: helicase-exonuclease AddAB subunit AddA [Clostridium sp.]